MWDSPTRASRPDPSELWVERCIFPLHISTNDDLYHLLADALVDEARAASADAGQYLEATLNTDRYGYPNIAITAEGLRGNQVVNNIVEAVNSIMSKALDGESFDVGMFVREAILIMRSMKKSSPQCFISRPAPVIMREYHPEMQQQGTDIFGRKDFSEVTNLVSSRIDISEETRCFLFTGHNFGSSGATSFAATRINQYLDAALLGEFGEDPDQLRVHDILQRFYCYHLVTVFSCNTQDVDVSCTCKENRDWSLCKHGYCAEVAVKTKLRFAPGQHKLPTIRRGRRSTKKRGPLERTYSGVSVPASSSHEQSSPSMPRNDREERDSPSESEGSDAGWESFSDAVIDETNSARDSTSETEWESFSEEGPVTVEGGDDAGRAAVEEVPSTSVETG
ncbi:hypothetical protein FOL46_001157, partial [Perkinsus olseni]